MMEFTTFYLLSMIHRTAAWYPWELVRNVKSEPSPDLLNKNNYF